MRLTRRNFLTTTAGAVGMALTQPSVAARKSKPLLSFSTLGCPKWTLDQILTCAATNGYQGVELRGLQGELDLPKCPEFSSPERIRETHRRFTDKNLALVDLGSSTRLHIADPTKRREQLDHAKRFIDLAAQLSCPYVRVFPNELPKDQDRAQTIDLITSGLVELGTYTARSPVTVLLETHGDVVQSQLLGQIMANANNPKTGLIWDFVNMWSVTKEPPAQVYQTLKPYIRHVHVKDVRLEGGKVHGALLGEGEAPITEAIQALIKGGYQGYYSFEWEKLWEPDLQEPEVAFPQYAKAVQRYFS